MRGDGFRKIGQACGRQEEPFVLIGDEDFRLQWSRLYIILKIKEFKKVRKDATEATCKMEACVEAHSAAVEAVEKTTDVGQFFNNRDLPSTLGKKQGGSQSGYA